MLDRLICPLPVLFDATIGSRGLLAIFGLSAGDFAVKAERVSALTVFTARVELSLPAKFSLPWLENPEEDVGEVSSASLASAKFRGISLDTVGDVGCWCCREGANDAGLGEARFKSEICGYWAYVWSACSKPVIFNAESRLSVSDFKGRKTSCISQFESFSHPVG